MRLGTTATILLQSKRTLLRVGAAARVPMGAVHEGANRREIIVRSRTFAVLAHAWWILRVGTPRCKKPTRDRIRPERSGRHNIPRQQEWPHSFCSFDTFFNYDKNVRRVGRPRSLASRDDGARLVGAGRIKDRVRFAGSVSSSAHTWRPFHFFKFQMWEARRALPLDPLVRFARERREDCCLRLHCQASGNHENAVVHPVRRRAADRPDRNRCVPRGAAVSSGSALPHLCANTRRSCSVLDAEPF